MTNSKIYEGLNKADLKDLVVPLVSIDEYESKIVQDNQVIVSAFFVLDEDPAFDLSRFIERSVLPILDTDVSPAPNEEGYFVVFVEAERNKEYPDTLLKLLEEIMILIEIPLSKWEMKIFHHDELHEVNEDNLKKYIELEVKEEDVKESLKDFLSKNTLLDQIDIKRGTIVLEKRKKKYIYELVKFGPMLDILENLQLVNKVPVYEDITKGWKIENLLGPNWKAERLEEYLVLTKNSSSNCLVLRP